MHKDKAIELVAGNVWQEKLLSGRSDMSKDSSRWGRIQDPKKEKPTPSKKGGAEASFQSHEQNDKTPESLVRQQQVSPRSLMGERRSEEEGFFEKLERFPLIRTAALIFGLPLIAVVVGASIKTIQLLWTSPHGHYAAIGITVVALFFLLVSEELF